MGQQLASDGCQRFLSGCISLNALFKWGSISYAVKALPLGLIGLQNYSYEKPLVPLNKTYPTEIIIIVSKKTTKPNLT